MTVQSYQITHQINAELFEKSIRNCASTLEKVEAVVTRPGKR